MPTPGAQSAAQNHVVTLNYAGPPPTFTADPPSVKVKNKETISFKLGTAPPNSTFRVTFSTDDRDRFSAPVFNDGDAPVTIKGKDKDPAHTTKYLCQLFVNGNPIPSGKDAGGEIELPPGT